jgi:nitronate monooxygenase
VQEIRAVVRRPLIALSGAIANGRADPGGAGDGRRPRLYRLGLHRHQGSQRRRRATSSDRRLGGAEDIVYSNLFTGVHGNYLRPSIVAAGLDPDNLPVSDPSKMNFGSGGTAEPRPGATSGAAARASAMASSSEKSSPRAQRIAAVQTARPARAGSSSSAAQLPSAARQASIVDAPDRNAALPARAGPQRGPVRPRSRRPVPTPAVL